MNVFEIMKEWGWLGVILLYFAPQIWKFFADKLWPERIKDRRETARAVRETEATLLRARIEREDRESEQRLKLEERTVTAIEGILSTLAIIQQLQATLQLQMQHHETFTFNSSQDIKTGIEKLHDLDNLRKKQDELEKKVQDTQDKIKKVGSS